MLAERAVVHQVDLGPLRKMGTRTINPSNPCNGVQYLYTTYTHPWSFCRVLPRLACTNSERVAFTGHFRVMRTTEVRRLHNFVRRRRLRLEQRV